MACALVAGLAIADGVESANTVGYSDVSVAAGTFIMIGAQFTKVGAQNIPIGDLIQGDFAPATYSKRLTEAPQIQILNAAGTGYTTYYYLSDAEDDEENEVLGWADGVGDLVTTINLNPGDAVWFKAITATNLKLKGEVISGNTKAITVTTTKADQFSMIANPFPTTLDINDITWSGLTPSTYSKRLTEAPQIQVLNAAGTGYTTYYYINDAEDENEDEVTGWADGVGDLAETAIGVGKGFWLKLPTAGTVTATFAL